MLRPPYCAEIPHLVAFLQQDASDADLPEEALASRDREVGRQLSGADDSSLSLLLGWISSVAGDAVEQARRGVRATSVALVTLGLCLGASTAGAVFHYTGEHPVNVVHVLGFFVLLQLILLLLWLLAALPPAISAKVPGVLAIQDLLMMLNPGQLRRWLSARLAPDYAAALRGADERGQAHLRLYADLERKVALHASQILAVAFNLAAVVTLLVLVTTSDLAFAWSTTLEVDAAEFHRITSFLALPWSWLWAEAVPSVQLIQESAYYRFQGGQLEAAAVDLGQWWRFLLAAMLTYGLLPRLATLFVSRRCLSRSVAETLHAHPSAPLICSRLTHALVSTQAAAPDVDAESAVANSAVADSAISGEVMAVNWADVGLANSAIADLLAGLGLSATRHLAAGKDLAADEAVIAKIAAADSAVALVVKAWEPPMGDVLDFLEDLREAIGERSVMLVPVGQGRAAANDDQLRIWRQRCSSLANVRGV